MDLLKLLIQAIQTNQKSTSSPQYDYQPLTPNSLGTTSPQNIFMPTTDNPDAFTTPRNMPAGQLPSSFWAPDQRYPTVNPGAFAIPNAQTQTPVNPTAYKGNVIQL